MVEIKEIMTLAQSHHHKIDLVYYKNKYYIKKELIPSSVETIRINQLIWEGETLKKLNHKHLVKCLESVSDNSNHYIILELIQGTSLFYNLKTRKFKLYESLTLILQLLYTVQYLHENKIIHNDLNPSNMFLENGNIKLIDLSVSVNKNSLSGRKASPEFSAPEQIYGKRSTTKTDVWAIGCILYYMLVGRRPFRHIDGTYEQLNMNIDLSLMPVTVPIEIENLILRMTNKNIKERADMEDCIKLVQDFLE